MWMSVCPSMLWRSEGSIQEPGLSCLLRQPLSLLVLLCCQSLAPGNSMLTRLPESSQISLFALPPISSQECGNDYHTCPCIWVPRIRLRSSGSLGKHILPIEPSYWPLTHTHISLFTFPLPFQRIFCVNCALVGQSLGPPIPPQAVSVEECPPSDWPCCQVCGAFC